MSSLGGLDRPDPPSSSATQSRPNRARGRTESSSSTSDFSNSHHSNGSASLMPPDHNRPRSSSSSSKALLTMALLEAQSAVRLDYTNDIPAALSSYRQAVTLLSRVMEASSSEDEQERLRTIHDSYLFRIHLLSTPPTPTTPSGTFAQHPGHSAQSEHSVQSGHSTQSTQATQDAQSTHSGQPGHSGYSGQSLSQPPPPQQPLPQPPRQQNATRPAGASSLSSITPVSSPSTLSSQQRGDDSDSAPMSGSLAQVTAVPPPRRVRKHVPVPLQPSSMPSSGTQYPEPRTPRQRSDSTSTNEHSSLGGTPGQTRHHTRSHTGGSIHRVTGDLVQAAEQLQIHAQQRMPGVPKVRSRDHLGVPIDSAPNVPLPPTPTTLGPPPSMPPPMPMSQPGHGLATSGNPPTPSLPSLPPPKTPVPPAPSNFTSPPASPANASRRISPLVPVSSSLGLQHQPQQQQQQAVQKSFLSPPESSPEEEKTNEATPNNFYDDDLVSDEWLPNLSSTGFSTSEASLEHSSEDPYPRERITSKGKGF
ncbi:hypothetical protein EDD21DRAFT_105987 [Dissophora ornata]|nr:hypothetical protein EDD21DRAFT_105987 [Dissophora ornata]